MVEPGVKINTSKFVAALRAKVSACRGSFPDVLNHAAKNVAFRAASFTPKANPAKIRADLMRDPHLRYALTAMALKKKGVGALKSPEFAKAVAKFVSRRASSANYLRAMWANAVEQLGGTFKGSKFKGADGFANEASAGKLLAQIVAITNQPNERSASGAEQIGLDAVRKAIDFVAADMLEYAQRKVGLAAAS